MRPTDSVADKKRRVAVVAFHGVADQKPFETAQAIAGMLLDLRDKRGVKVYSDFRESQLRLPVTAVTLSSYQESGEPRKGFSMPHAPRDPRSEVLKQLHAKDKGTSPAAKRIQRALNERASVVEAEERSTADTLDHEYTRDQLAFYDPAKADLRYNSRDSVYETIQLNGFRHPGGSESGDDRDDDGTGSPPPPASPGGNQGCEVHIFEMYWADLSRASSSWVRVVVDFYQLIAYLCSIGRKTLDFARAAMPYSLWWKAFAFSQWGGERLLTQFVPALNLCLLGIAAAALLPFQVPPSAYHKAAIAAVTLSFALISGLVINEKREEVPAKRWPWFVLGVFLAGGLGAFLALCSERWLGNYGFYAVLMWGWWLVVAVFIYQAMRAYGRRVIGADIAGIGCIAFTSIYYGAALFMYARASGGIANRLLAAAAETACATGLVLVAVWYFYSVFAVIVSITGGGVSGPASVGCPSPDRDAVRRAVWTVNLTLLLPGALTLLANLALWKAVSIALNKLPWLRDPQLILRKPPSGFFGWGVRVFEINGATTTTTRGVIAQLIECFASGWFTLFFAFFGLAALLAMWAILPAITSNNAPGQDVRASTWLGQALSAGYRSMRVSGEIIRFIVLAGSLGMLALLSWCFFKHQSFFALVPPYLKHPGVLSALGLILWAMLIGSQGYLRFLALGFRTAIDIALDVANWLRYHPRDFNSKARISARCVSQLEYIAGWRDPRDGGSYDSLVIIAHSQGSVIAAELLRFLQVDGHPWVNQFGDRKIYLFTMGCPLRQLYSLRFPHQYAWARHNADSWAGKEPDPGHLGIAEWVNAYRSGDYVGRYLWHVDTGDEPWDCKERPLAGNDTRREFCIGPGDHTHYWEKTAPKIAEELDRLIATACAG